MRIKLLLLYFLLGFVPHSLTTVGSGNNFAISGVTLIDGTGNAPRFGITILVSGERIAAIRPDEGPLEGYEIIPATGKYVIPGLWDMHVHLTYVGDVACPVLIANGVTSVCDLGGSLEGIDWLRNQVATGALTGPRIFRAGPVVDGVKPGVRDRIVIETPEEGRRAVSFLKSRGVDFIKVHNGPEPAPYFALLEEARKQQIRVVGHIPLSVDPAKAIESGHGTVEHIVSLFEGPARKLVQQGKTQEESLAAFTDAEALRLAQKMIANKTCFDPTLIAYWTRSYQWEIREKGDPREKYVSQSAREFWKIFSELPDTSETRTLLKRAYDRFAEITKIQHREGVRILVGTDLAAPHIYPGFSVHDELRLLVQSGMTPMEAILAATRNPADSIGKLTELGTIEEGKMADLVVLEGNPLEKIDNTTQIFMVIAGGKIFQKSELDAMLQKVAGAAPSR